MNHYQVLLQAYKTLLMTYRQLIQEDKERTIYKNYQTDLIEKRKDIKNTHGFKLNRFLTLTLIFFPILDEWFIEELFNLQNIKAKEILSGPKVKHAFKVHPTLFLKYYLIG
jgi:hypothetical protein